MPGGKKSNETTPIQEKLPYKDAQDSEPNFEVVVKPKGQASQYVSDFDPRLNVKYAVHFHGKAGAWEKLKSYNRFQTFPSRDSVPVGSCIYVRGHTSPAEAARDKERKPSRYRNDESFDYVDWVAQVLECRAADNHNVFLRIVWLYWPDDLEPYARRQDYHGSLEVIPSNDMQIINAISVAGKVKVHRWHDDQYPNLSPQFIGSGDLIWRQTLDVHSPKKTALLPEPAKHCICNKPVNPQRYLIQCQHCQRWMHEECITSSAAEDAAYQWSIQNQQTPESLDNGDDPTSKPTQSSTGVIARFMGRMKSKPEKSSLPPNSPSSSLIIPIMHSPDHEEQHEESKPGRLDTEAATRSKPTSSSKRKRTKSESKTGLSPHHKKRFENSEFVELAKPANHRFSAEVDEETLEDPVAKPTLRVRNLETGASQDIPMKCLFQDCGKPMK